MKAAVFHEHGGPEKLVFEDISEPKAGPKEVLVRVRACSINHLDIWIRQGIPAYRIHLPHVSGADVSGEIAGVGNEVKGIKEGMKVVVAPGLSCFECEYCLSGHDNLCQSYTILGTGVDGGYAEFVAVPAVNVIPLSDTVSFEVAAAFPLTFLTAWHMLVTRCALRAGQDVLILAAGSGIGSAAIQIAKLAGARVIAAAGTEEKCSRAKDLGANDVIVYSREDFSKRARALTHGRGVDIVFEHIGEETWQKSIMALAKNGKLVTCGATTGNEAKLDLRYLFSKQLSVLGAMMGLRSELLTLVRLVSENKLKPVMDMIFPLAQACQAQERMLERKNFGKILLIP